MAHHDIVEALDENAQQVVENLQLGENNSNITASSEPPLQSADTAASANGPLGLCKGSLIYIFWLGLMGRSPILPTQTL